MKRQYKVRIVGQLASVHQRFYAITVERKLRNRVLCQVPIWVERVETGCSETPGPIAAWRVRSEFVVPAARTLARAVRRDRRRGSTTTTVRV